MHKCKETIQGRKLYEEIGYIKSGPDITNEVGIESGWKDLDEP